MKQNINPIAEVKWYEYLPILIRPTIIGIIAAIAWYYLRGFNHLIPAEDQGIFEPLLTIAPVIHGFLAAFQIQKVSDQDQKIEIAFMKRDREMFEEYACLRIRPVVKFLLALFSIIIFFIFTLYPFQSAHAGVITIWIIMFSLYLLWQVAVELDDPFHGIKKITPEMIEEAFGEEKSSEIHSNIV